MSTLIRWDPFKEMEVAQNRLARFFGMASARVTNGDKEAMTVTEWAPSVDIVEDEKEYVVKADLPEVKKEDVKVTVENGVLTITGERKVEKEEKGKKYHRIERAYGNFLRSFALPDAADGSKVTAEFKDGVFEDREGKAEIGRGQGRMMPIGKKRAGQRSGGMWRVPPARGRLWPQS